MREILFRRKALRSGEWHFGMFCAEGYGADFPCIIPSDSDRMHIASGDWHVDLETVGQFTGLLDKNGTKIFEGDIIKSSCDFDDSEDYAIELIVLSIVRGAQGRSELPTATRAMMAILRRLASSSATSTTIRSF